MNFVQALFAHTPRFFKQFSSFLAVHQPLDDLWLGIHDFFTQLSRLSPKTFPPALFLPTSMLFSCGEFAFGFENCLEFASEFHVGFYDTVSSEASRKSKACIFVMESLGSPPPSKTILPNEHDQQTFTY